jgi:hypothetical protein
VTNNNAKPSKSSKSPPNSRSTSPLPCRKAQTRDRLWIVRRALREHFLYDFKGGSLRSPPAARLRALAALASSPAATGRGAVAACVVATDRLGVHRGQLVPLRNAAR